MLVFIIIFYQSDLFDAIVTFLQSFAQIGGNKYEASMDY